MHNRHCEVDIISASEHVAVGRTVVVTYLLSLYVSLTIVFGYRASNDIGLFTNPLMLFVALIVCFALCFAVLMLVWKVLDKVQLSDVLLFSASVERPVRACFMAGFVMVICWAPILLAGYPGFFSYDAGLADPLMQWAQIEQGALNAHHPIIHTLFLGTTIKLGWFLFGSFNAGICFSVSVQALMIATSLSYSLYLLINDGMSKFGFGCSVAYFAFDPIIGMFALCTTKDTLFSAAVVLLCLFFVKLAQFPDHCERKELARLCVPIILLGFLICILRSNALVALVVMSPFVFIVLRRNVKRAFAICIIVALSLSCLWLGPFSSTLGVASSPIGKWNALGLPMQQIARCAFDEDVSSEDREHVIEVMGEDIKYKQNNSDVARDVFVWGKATGSEIIDLYVELAKKYPFEYVEAFLYQTEDAWSPFATIDAYNYDDGNTSVFNYRTMEPGKMEPKLPWLSNVLDTLSTKEGPKHILGVHFLISIACYIYIMMLCLTRGIIVKDKSMLCFVIPLAVLTLSNLLGPCMIIRYYLYLFLALPMMFYYLLRKPRQLYPSITGRAEDDSRHCISTNY